MKSNIFNILVLSVFLKILYIGFAFVLESNTDYFGCEHSTEGVISLFKRHDAYWYQNIHDNGYPEVNSRKELGWHNDAEYHQSRWGFMPGYPLAIKVISSLLNISFNASAFIISIVFSTLCFILFYWLSSLWFQKTKNAFYATLLFMVMPFNYYFSMMYTEAIFCSLLFGALIAVKKKKYILLAILTAIMTIFRANGLVLLLPIALFVLENENLLENFKLKKAIWNWNILKKFAFLFLPILTFSGYCYYQYIKTGYPNAYSIAQQEGWYRELMFPIGGLFRSGDFVTQFNSWYSIVIIIISTFTWKKLPLSYNLIIWISILLPLSSGSSIAMTRYISIIFPLYFMFAYWLKDVKWKMALVPIFLILQLYSFHFWLISDSFSQ
ncbi:mannosyltransferase family protein [Flavobacteriales bacterium]|nr:mannosyltransferase family protein [Flavobacteriales bacterium]